MESHAQIIKGSAPVFYVRDLVKSVNFYVDILGFKRPHLWGDPPGFAMPDRDGIIIMLSQQEDHQLINPKTDIWDMYFWVSDIDKLYQEFLTNGVEFTQELIYKELYGNREFIVRDLDGYTLAFGKEIHDVHHKKPQSEFLQLNPVITSQDVARDVSWYGKKLGFKKSFDSGDIPLNYAGVSRQGLSLHIQFQFPDYMTCTDLRFAVRNIDSIFQEYIESGVVTKEVMKRNTAWGTNEFGLFDPSGNRIHFYEDI